MKEETAVAEMIVANQKPDSDTVELGQFNGVPIHARQSDQYVNATAMCKAAGKEWSNYWKNQQTQDFVDALSSHLLIRSCDLTQSIKGYGTWVHRRVALDLARWCSPEFAVKVNGWIDQLLTGGLIEQPTSLQERLLAQVVQNITILTTQQGGIVQDVGECKSRLTAVETKQEEILTAIYRNVRRKNPSADTRRILTETVFWKHHGYCPCCNTTRIVGVDGKRLDNAEFDHFFKLSEITPDKMWLICAACNLSLRNEDERRRIKPKFDAFQVGRDERAYRLFR